MRHQSRLLHLILLQADLQHPHPGLGLLLLRLRTPRMEEMAALSILQTLARLSVGIYLTYSSLQCSAFLSAVFCNVLHFGYCWHPMPSSDVWCIWAIGARSYVGLVWQFVLIQLGLSKHCNLIAICRDKRRRINLI